MPVEGWDHLVKKGWTVTPRGCWEYDGYRNSTNGYERVHTGFPISNITEIFPRDIT